MTEKVARLRQRLVNSRDYADRVFDQVGDRWEVQVYDDGDHWTAHQIVVHLSEADRGQSNVVMEIAAGRDPIPADFDINRYNQRVAARMGDVTVEQARSSLASSRAALLEWMETLDDEALARQGRHASLNILTVEQYLKVIAIHERDHARDIAGKLGITASDPV